MAFLGLELGAGLSAAVALAILAVLWDYSSLSDVEWEEITAGVMLFVAAAGVELLAGQPQASSSLAAYAPSVSQLLNQVVAPAASLLGGALILWGGLRNSWQVLRQQM